MTAHPVTEDRPAIDLGTRIAQARREAGLTQRALAEHLALPLWRVDHFESGRLDVTNHLPAIADATRKPREWFEPEPNPEPVLPPRTGRALGGRLAFPHFSGSRDLVLGAVVLIVVVRFFTEVVPVIPRAANFVDVPLVLVLALAAVTRPVERTTRPRVSFALPVVLFLAVAAISVAANPERVEPGPVLVFLYGFLAPIAIYAAVYRLWPVGEAMALSRLLVVLGVVQLVVVLVIDLPRFLASGNPDEIAGTFGTNAYQLVFFLLVFIGLVAGIFTHEKGRTAARFAPLLIGGTLVTIFLAQYRALLVTAAVTVILIAVLLGWNVRAVVTALLVAGSFVIALNYVASRFPILNFFPTITTLQERPEFFVSKRLEATRSVNELYGDEVRAVLTGTGPGTFSSRGWQTFALSTSPSRSNVQGRYALALTGGRAYQTDVSEEYVASRLRQSAAVLGSRALTSPFSSYLSLLAEVGVFGFALVVAIYLRATTSAARIAMSALRRPRRGDPLPALALACAVAFTVLVQMAFLDNWLEVTRVTFPAWILLAVVTKELGAREVT